MSEYRSIREWANHHATVIGTVFIGIAVLAVVWSQWPAPRGSGSIPAHQFFVDELTGNVVLQPLDAIPPLPGSDGQLTLVRGCFYTLGTDDEKTLVYLEKFRDPARVAEAARESTPDTNSAPPEMLVRAPEPGSEWVPLESPAGQKIIARLLEVSGKPGFRIVTPK